MESNKNENQSYDPNFDLYRLMTFADFKDFQKINDYLFIGSQISALQQSRLKKEGITQVLKVNGIPTFLPMGVDCKIVSMEDMPEYDITLDELNECLNYIQEGQQSGKKTLVVCTAGISRSATVCIAYLMKHEG